MKSYGHLWDEIVSPANLYAAWRHFQRTHVGEKKVVWWAKRAESRLAALGRELCDGSYRPGPYHRFYIYEPKPRSICRAPIRDRIVHHALCEKIVPLLERRFIYRTYACRKGKGSHLACIDARRMCARGGWFLKMDVRHYFDSIDLGILKSLLMPMFREQRVRNLIDLIIDNKKGIPEDIGRSKGLPLGNLTSQWFANLYLDECDHYATEKLGLGDRYFRYMDDFLVFSDTAAECHAVHSVLSGWLREHRDLELKEEATVVAPISEGVPFLGLRIWADRWRLRRSRYRRAHRTGEMRYLQFVNGEIDLRRLQQCGRSHAGSIEWFGFKGILRHVGERTLAGKRLVAADDGLPITERQEVAEVLQEPLPSNVGPAADRPVKVRSGGSWNNSPVAGITSLGARAGNNAPSNADNNNNGFRLASAMKEMRRADDDASTRTPGVTLPLGATLSPRHDGENFMGQFRRTCAPDSRRRTCTDRTGTSTRPSAQPPVRVHLFPCGGRGATRPTDVAMVGTAPRAVRGGRGATRPTDGALVGRDDPIAPDSFRFEKGETR